jgi:hypothetical protein
VSPSANLRAAQSFQADGGDRYVIPADAAPYLGELDRSLFDVTALAKAGVGKTGKIPLEPSFPGGASRHPERTGRLLTLAEGAVTAIPGHHPLGGAHFTKSANIPGS